MSTFTATDEIRSRGVGVSLTDCPKCEAARAMDDLRRLAIQKANAHRENAEQELKLADAKIGRLYLALFVAVVTLGFVLASDLGFFKP